MNAAAFRRGEAITRLENYAPVIVEHLALVTWFSDHSACSHWKAELTAVRKALTRYNSGKGSKFNFTKQIIVDSLLEMFTLNEDKDYILIGVESHGVNLPENIDWSSLEESVERFANELMQSSK